MATALKHAVYRAAKLCGLFALARRRSRGRLRILAYHGFALNDEAEFRAKLFIRPETFARRLALLQRQGYRVIGLDQAVAGLDAGQLPDDAVVITIDDGFASTLSVAGPILKRHGFPAIVYLTTYHMLKQTPVFDLAMGYLVWKSPLSAAELVWPAGNATLRLDLADPPARERSAARLVAMGKAMASESERRAFSQAVAQALAVDHAALEVAGSFRLMRMDEAAQLAGHGIAVGLHTHRHRFPPGDESACREEITLNQRLLEQGLAVRAEHFCYPSGEYSPCQWPWLASLGVASATTCDTGLAKAGDPRYGLKRFLDGESVTDLEFEAELCGFSEFLRQALRVDRRAPGAAGPTLAA